MLGLEQDTGPEDVVRYWVESHPNCHKHTLAMVMEYAKAREHRLLQEEFSRLISSEYSQIGLMVWGSLLTRLSEGGKRGGEERESLARSCVHVLESLQVHCGLLELNINIILVMH